MAYRGGVSNNSLVPQEAVQASSSTIPKRLSTGLERLLPPDDDLARNRVHLLAVSTLMGIGERRLCL